MTKQLKVAIMAGGYSSEAEVSKRSAAQAYDSLRGGLFEPYIVEVSLEGWFCNSERVNKDNFSTPTLGKFDYALIMIHGTPGENGPLQGYFDLVGVPYSTSPAGIMAITFDKKLCKRALRDTEGINLAKEVIISKGESYNAEQIAESLSLPFFVKPTQSGSSFGVTKIKNIEELDAAIPIALSECDEVLCEEFIEGTEVSQGVMICSGKEYVLPITELVTKNEFFDYEAKYTEGLTQEITPARISTEIAQKISSATLAAYKSLGVRGVIRIDYIVKEGTPYFIEINGTPGMSAQSIVPQQWREAGLSMREAFEMIILSTLEK